VTGGGITKSIQLALAILETFYAAKTGFWMLFNHGLKVVAIGLIFSVT